MNNISIVLTPEEVQYVLNVLSEQPFKHVGALVPKIVEQAQKAQTQATGQILAEAPGA